MHYKLDFLISLKVRQENWVQINKFQPKPYYKYLSSYLNTGSAKYNQEYFVTTHLIKKQWACFGKNLFVLQVQKDMQPLWEQEQDSK